VENLGFMQKVDANELAAKGIKISIKDIIS